MNQSMQKLMNQFINNFGKMSVSRSTATCFHDFVNILFIECVSTSDSKELDETLREKYRSEYLSILDGYTENEHENIMSQMQLFAAMIVEGMQTGLEDILGYAYMQFSHKGNGLDQFFTPMHMSHLMALLAGDTENQKSPHIISDIACGSGAMPLGYARKYQDRGEDYRYKFVFQGQDLDEFCARMAYIQCFIYGIPARIRVGNSLTNEEPSAEWVTNLNALSVYSSTFMTIGQIKSAQNTAEYRKEKNV